MAEWRLTQERLRSGQEFLVGQGGTSTRSEILARVLEDTPLVGDELEQNSDGKSRGITNWLWYTTNLVKAGWLVKDGRGTWSITDAGRRALDQFPDAREFERAAQRGYQAWDKAQKADSIARLSAGRLDGPEESIVTAAAALFAEQGMGRGMSVLAPGRLIWTESNCEELERRIEGGSAAKVVERLEETLTGAPDDVIVLAAELLILHILPASTTAGLGEQAKRDRVTRVLNLMEHPIAIPFEVDHAFAAGAFNPGHMIGGHGLNSYRVIVRFAMHWARLDEDQRDALLGDPWSFRDFVFGVWPGRMPAQQRSLLFLIHPESFIPVVSGDQFAKIRQAFLGEIGGPSDDPERDMLGIVIALQVKRKGPVHFWDQDLLPLWNQTSTPIDGPDDPGVVKVPVTGLV